MSDNLSLWMQEMKESQVTSFPSSFLTYFRCIRAGKDTGTCKNKTVVDNNGKRIPKNKLTFLIIQDASDYYTIINMAFKVKNHFVL